MQYTAIEAARGSGILRHYEYRLGRFFRGYTLRKKVVESLEKSGFKVGEWGHITPTGSSPSPRKEPNPGFLYGRFIEGYTLRVNVPANPESRQQSLRLKDICDRL